MSQPVIIENDAIRMEVYPQIGGKVASIVDKADNFELMFDYPVELPTRPKYDIDYDDSWYAGWDECFPAVAKGKYPSHPYEEILVPDHGELWGIPTVAVPTRDGITTVWNGLRFGYRLTRKLHLEQSSILADYTLVNLSPFEFRFVWSMHAFMSTRSRVVLDLQPGVPFRYSHDAAGADQQQLFDWPAVVPGVDASVPDAMPERQGWKMFSMNRIEEAVKVRYPQRSRMIRMQYTSADQLPAYWGIWINTGGWAGNRHISIEPTTGRFDQLDRSIADGSAGRVEGSGRRQWSVRWDLDTIG